MNGFIIMITETNVIIVKRIIEYKIFAEIIKIEIIIEIVIETVLKTVKTDIIKIINYILI